MKVKDRAKFITKWIKDYTKKNKITALVVGVSGGIDSSVVSTLCAETGVKTIVVSMPIKQSKSTHSLSIKHGQWLEKKYQNVKHVTIDLNKSWKAFENLWSDANLLALANSRARLRMMTLYQLAQTEGGIVVGTGNKVEDFGVGFFTKYGDGGVDISPIGDCLKTEVWELGTFLGLLQEIIDAPPTDGLWDDGRTDEDQLGMSYPELESSMLFDGDEKTLTKDEKVRLKRYKEIRERNLHKMIPIPVCQFK
jgi:NAD+ synthase